VAFCHGTHTVCCVGFARKRFASRAQSKRRLGPIEGDRATLPWLIGQSTSRHAHSTGTAFDVDGIAGGITVHRAGHQTCIAANGAKVLLVEL
jgi:hypothetical protein